MADHKIHFLAKLSRKQSLDQNIAVQPAKPSPFLMRITLIESGHSHLSIRANLVKHGVVEIVIRKKTILCFQPVFTSDLPSDGHGRTDAGRTDTIYFLYSEVGGVFE